MKKKLKRFSCMALAALTAFTMFQMDGLDTYSADTTVMTEGFENATEIKLTKLGSYVSGNSNSDGGVSEIISYDNVNNKAWVVNGATGYIDVIDMSNITSATSSDMPATSIDIKAIVENKVADFTYGDMTSVSVNSEAGYAAVALQAAEYDKNGYVAVLTLDGTFVTMFPAGIQPDMVTFTPDGSKILVANEGEPRNGYINAVDPAGSVTIVTLNYAEFAQSTVSTVGFDGFDRDVLVASGVILGKYENADGNMVEIAPSTDFEPEYIAATNEVAYVSLQEANAIAVLDLTTGAFTGVYSLGYKDLSLEVNAVDLVDDGVYTAKTYTDAVGAYMPDGIFVYTLNGKNYILTANEGDAREWGDEDAGTDYCNEEKETLTSADGSEAKKVRVLDAELTDGLPEGKKVLYGGRSFSIYEVGVTGLTQVFDSTNELECLTASYIPAYFNASNDDNDIDSRSQKKGVEPESVTIGAVDGKTYAYVALERIGGIMVYDITDPANAKYCNYINTRDFSENVEDLEVGSGTYISSDVAPEGMYFISADQSPSNTAILLAAFEVSGTVAAYAVGDVPVKLEDAEIEGTEPEDTETEDTETEDTETEDTEIEDTEMEDTEIEDAETEDTGSNDTDVQQNVQDDLKEAVVAPKTGDNTTIGWFCIIMFAGMLIVGYVLGKKGIEI